MADQIIRPADLPNRANPVASEKIPVDNGVSVGGATIQSIVESGRPAASRPEAEAGVNSVKAMTPLTTDQKIEYEIGRSLASKAQGDKADSAIQEIIEGANTTVDNTDPQRPIISSSGDPSAGFKSDIVVVDGQTDWRIARNYKTVSDLLADDGSGDMGMGYAGSGSNVIVDAGQIITAQGFRYEVAAADAADWHVETAGGVKLRVMLGSDGRHNVLAWGARPDYASAKTDNHPIIQSALDTQRPVYIPAGHYYCSGPLHPYRGQIIEGDGVPERSVTNQPGVTKLTFAKDVTAFDNVPNVAIASSLRRLAIFAEDQTYGSGAIGIKLGEKGVVGGSSQAIKCHVEDVMVRGFDINIGIYGWAWEVTLVRVFTDYGRTLNLELADAFTLVAMHDCSFMLAGFPFGTDSGHSSDGVRMIGPDNRDLGNQVVMTGARFENNLNDGVSVNGNVRVTADGFYGEGNRRADINIASNFSGSFVADGGCCVHDNAGVTTFAALRVTSTLPSYICLTGFRFLVGKNNTNTITSGFAYIENTTPRVEVLGLLIGPDITKMSDGNKRVVYLSQSGRYAPNKFTIAGLSAQFYRAGTSHISSNNFRVGSLLASDGVNTFDMLTNGSTALENGNLYKRVSGSWELIAGS